MTDGTGSFGPSPLERIIIIGGAGFIGSHFTDRLMADVGTEQVTLFDNFSSGREEFFAHHQDDARLDSGFLVLYGDSYLNIDVAALWAASGDGARPVMSVLRNQGRWDASNAVYADGMVTLFEKGRADAAGATSDGGMEFIDYGISVLNADVIREHVPAGATYDLADVYQRLAAAGTLHGYEATERFYEIGSPQGLADLEAHLAGGAST